VAVDMRMFTRSTIVLPSPCVLDQDPRQRSRRPSGAFRSNVWVSTDSSIVKWGRQPSCSLRTGEGLYEMAVKLGGSDMAGRDCRELASEVPITIISIMI